MLSEDGRNTKSAEWNSSELFVLDKGGRHYFRSCPCYVQFQVQVVICVCRFMWAIIITNMIITISSSNSSSCNSSWAISSAIFLGIRP